MRERLVVVSGALLSLEFWKAEKGMIADRTTGRVPLAAGWLGGLGLIPFLGLALMIPFSSGSQRSQLAFALLAYGATILSFLGGIQWGLAIADANKTDPDPSLPRRLVVSVIPSLTAWSCLFMSTRLSGFLLAAAFGAMLIVDIRAAQSGEAPIWYPRLRWPLSCAAIVALIVGGLA